MLNSIYWNQEDAGIRGALLAIIGGVEFTAPDGKLTLKAESMINKNWSELEVPEQDILKNHGIAAD